MSFKVVFLCASVLLVKSITAQIINSGVPCNGLSNGLNLNGNGINLSGLGLGLNNGLGNSGYGNGGANNLNNLNNGGGFAVTSTSPIAPTGISVLADNLLIEGPLNVAGSLPVLATVGLEGQLPTSGQASISYSCGDGNIGITSQKGAAGSNYGSALGNGASLTNCGAGIVAGSSLYGAGLANSNGGRVY